MEPRKVPLASMKFAAYSDDSSLVLLKTRSSFHIEKKETNQYKSIQTNKHDNIYLSSLPPQYIVLVLSLLNLAVIQIQVHAESTANIMMQASGVVRF